MDPEVETVFLPDTEVYDKKIKFLVVHRFFLILIMPLFI